MDKHDQLRLQRAIVKRKESRAESLTVLERLSGGAELYDQGMRWLAFAIRGENPEFSDQQVDAELRRRKAIIRKIDDHGLYRPCGIAESTGND